MWRPLKRLQGERKAGKDGSSDLVGLEFVLAQPIDRSSAGKQRYSGIEWRVEVSSQSGVTSIAAGERVVVTSVDVGVFRVQPADTASAMNE